MYLGIVVNKVDLCRIGLPAVVRSCFSLFSALCSCFNYKRMSRVVEMLKFRASFTCRLNACVFCISGQRH
jgi:hypothetical protein